MRSIDGVPFGQYIAVVWVHSQKKIDPCNFLPTIPTCNLGCWHGFVLYNGLFVSHVYINFLCFVFPAALEYLFSIAFSSICLFVLCQMVLVYVIFYWYNTCMWSHVLMPGLFYFIFKFLLRIVSIALTFITCCKCCLGRGKLLPDTLLCVCQFWALLAAMHLHRDWQ